MFTLFVLVTFFFCQGNMHQDDDTVSQRSGISNYSSHTLDIHQEGEGLLQYDLEERLSRLKLLANANHGDVARDPSERIIKSVLGGKDPVNLAPYLTTPRDSNDPSYTNLVLPYYAVCRQRYYRAQKMMEKQFIKEVREHEAFQNDGLDGIRIHREFCKSVIRYPKPSELVRLTPQQKRRLEAIMRNEY